MSVDRTTCRGCHEPLGIGRFCTNCGRPKDDATTEGATVTTAERPAVPPRRAPTVPPPVHEAPRPPRFPLWADDSATPPPTPPSALPPETAVPSVSAVSQPLSRHSSARRSVTAAVALLVLVLVGAGGVLLAGGWSSEPDAASPGATTGTSSPTESTPPTSGKASTDAVDLTRNTEAIAPDTAGPSRDVRGNAVRYEAFNMLDGQPDTAWRMAGDGTGREIVLRLDAPARISQVGLINGYAKIDDGYDGYRANRRIAAVEWDLGDGSVVAQDLIDTPEVQRIDVDDVMTDVVRLRIVEVSGPTAGPTGRDYTAISEVVLVGTRA